MRDEILLHIYLLFQLVWIKAHVFHFFGHALSPILFCLQLALCRLKEFLYFIFKIHTKCILKPLSFFFMQLALCCFSTLPSLCKGSGIPKVVNLEVQGELVEGNVIKGFAEVAWCGGTPGKGVARYDCMLVEFRMRQVVYVLSLFSTQNKKEKRKIKALCNCADSTFSWLRRRWNSSPVVIAGAEEEEYQLTIDDVDSSLVFMYTPVTEEGAKGEPQYKYTDFIKAGVWGNKTSM